MNGFNAAALVATIRLDGIQKFSTDLSGARRELQSTDTTASRMSATVKSALTSANVMLAGVTIAAGNLASKVFSIGAAYNTLQQTSRAAMTTLLGSAKNANAQMDRLDEFATSSPFAKQVFITAQQQLISFGTSARKVIPTLDAIQNAVAAMGGSSQQVGELAFVIAQIGAAGKITGQDLIQFGQRGVNAAELIGKALGKTGKQIRADITAGALDAGVAVDALVKGMAARFDGAAANVKNTVSGTADRIKAATRDIGSALAEPFIARQGGGAAILWGNQVADVLRSIQRQTTPVVDIVMRRLAPAFASVTELLDRAKVAVDTFNPERLDQGLEKLAQYQPIITALAASLVAVSGNSIANALPLGLGALVPKIHPVVAGLAAIAATSPEARAGLQQILNAAKPLAPAVTQLGKVLVTGLQSGLAAVLPVAQAIAPALTSIAQVIASIPAPVTASVIAFLAMSRAIGPLTPMVKSVVDGFRAFGDQVVVQRALAATRDEFGNIVRQGTLVQGTFGVVGKAATGAGAAMKAAFLSNPVGLALLALSGIVAVVTAGFAAQQEKVEAARSLMASYKSTVNEATGALTAQSRALAKRNLEDKGVRESADKMGIAFERIVDAALGDAQAIAEVKAAQDAYNKSLDETAIAEMDGAYSAEYAIGVNAKYQAMKVDLTEVLGEQQTAAAAAAKAAMDDANAIREANATMSDGARSTVRYNEAVKILRDTGADAVTKLNALKAALDELSGGTKSQAQQTRELNDQQRTLNDTFGKAGGGKKSAAQRVVGADGVIDTTTRAGSNLSVEVERLNDQMLDAIRTAAELADAAGKPFEVADAEAAAQPYFDTITKAAERAGLTKDQIDGMTRTMLDIPAAVHFVITDDGDTSQRTKDVAGLAAQILALPKGESITIGEGTIPDLERMLARFGTDIEDLPSGTVKVQKDDGSFDTLERALDRLTAARTIRINVSGGPNEIPQANGGLWSHGVKAFANGGIAPGIYKNGPLYKFAEPETGWEAYISGKPGQEARNRVIWEEAGRRLGVGRSDGAPSSAPQSPAGAPINVTINSPVVRSAADAEREALDIALAVR